MGKKDEEMLKLDKELAKELERLDKARKRALIYTRKAHVLAKSLNKK